MGRLLRLLLPLASQQQQQLASAPSSPPSGCFVDSRTGFEPSGSINGTWRQLSHLQCACATGKGALGCCDLSQEWCGQQCDRAGFAVAAVEAGHACFCGHELENASASARLTSNRSCDTPCNGAFWQTCGAPWEAEAFPAATMRGQPVPRVRRNADCPGHNLAAPRANSSAAACSTLCAQTAGCWGFVLTRQQRSCLLKRNCSVLTPAPGDTVVS